jgi:hypothetical protein
VEAGEIEEEQGMKMARAAAATRTLEHYIWSTTPSAKRMLRGALEVPHMDYKANVDARIKAELPRLAAITSYMYYGYYPQNMAFFPMCKPVELVSSPRSQRRHPQMLKYWHSLAPDNTSRLSLQQQTQRFW